MAGFWAKLDLQYKCGDWSSQPIEGLNKTLALTVMIKKAIAPKN